MDVFPQLIVILVINVNSFITNQVIILVFSVLIFQFLIKNWIRILITLVLNVMLVLLKIYNVLIVIFYINYFKGIS